MFRLLTPFGFRLRHVGRWRRRLLVGAAVGAVAIAVALAWPFDGPAPFAVPADALAQPYEKADGFRPPRLHTTATPQPTVTPTPIPTCPRAAVTTVPGLPRNWPVAVEIPSIEIVSLVEEAGLDRHGNMQVPAHPCDTAWYAAGATPAAPGDAVFGGHLDWYGQAAVFMRLGAVVPGAEIDVILAGGGRLRFAVSTLRYVPYQSRPTWLFTTSGAPTISLYTCAGSWQPSQATYSERLIVTASLVSRS